MTWYRSKNLKHSWCYQNSPLYLQCLVLIETRWFLLFLKRMRQNLAKPLYLFFQIMSTVTASPKMTHTPTDAPTTANTAEVSPWSTEKTFINSDIRLLCLLSNHAGLNSTFRLDKYLGKFGAHTVCRRAGDVVALRSSQLWHRHASIVLSRGVEGWKNLTAAIYGPRDDSTWLGLCLTHTL